MSNRSRSIRSRSIRSSARAATLLATLLAAGLGGCQGLGNVIGGTGGVMPDSDLGPPPTLRSEVKTQTTGFSNVDEDGNPLPTKPSRQLALPKAVGGTVRTADEGTRRINREELSGGNAVPTRGSAGGGMAPSLSQGGGVGLGGSF